MSASIRPESMARITNFELANAFIDQQVAQIRQQVGDKKVLLALSGEALKKAIEDAIRAKDGSSLVGNMASQGTTPRRLTDLIGSLCDLTSGSGDKGTPIIHIQGYFDNYTND